MTVTLVSQPMNAVVTVMNAPPIPCDGTPHTRTVQVAVAPDAPLTPITFDLQAISPAGPACVVTASVTVEPINRCFRGDTGRRRAVCRHGRSSW